MAHVASIVQTYEEVMEALEVVALIHQRGGWEVTCGEDTVVCRRGRIIRCIYFIREGPLD